MSAGTPFFRTVALGLIASALLGCPRHETPPPAAGPRLLFRTAEEARAYILARILAVENAPDAGDLYAGTLVRSYKTLDGNVTHHYLVAEPARELALAEGFQAHGFVKEALAHYENLVAYFPETAEGKRACERVVECRRATVLSLVEPMSVVVEGEMGERCVPASGRFPDNLDLKRIQDPLLTPALADSPLEVVGFIDDAGGIVAEEGGLRILRKKIVEAKEPLGEGSLILDHKGAVHAGRGYYGLESGSRTLFEEERRAKASLLRDRLEKAADDAARRRLAEDFLYVGCRAEAAEILEGMGESLPPNPLDGDLAALAARPDHPLALDALWLLKVRDNPRFTLSTKSCVTTGGELPVEVDAHAIDRMTFRFARLKGPVPAEEGLVKKWIAEAGAEPSHEVTLAVPPGKSTLSLPVREAGAWRVTAEARGVSCAFTAVRTDASLEAFLLPSEVMFLANRGGFSICSGRKKLGATDDEGFTSTSSSVTVLKGRICEEHRQCCAGCESCLHHHAESTSLVLKDQQFQVFVAGNGQFFRATAKADAAEPGKVKAPVPAPVLLVTTDRPAYKAGDTMRFRGILRRPRVPLHRRDASRLDPSPEQEVQIAIRCGETALFQRTYVTGEFGTFSGEYVLPLTASRAEYSIAVENGGVKASQPFEVLDYRKSDYVVLLTPEAGGFRVQAGYVWGAPVPGAEVRCTVDGKEVQLKDGFVPAKDGQRVRAALARNGEELARKSQVWRARPGQVVPEEKAPEAETAAAPKEDAPPQAVPAPSRKEEAPAFRIRASRPVYRRGEEIELEIDAPWAGEEAIVVLADLQLYDLARVRLREGRAQVRFSARPIHDPGTTAFALCKGQVARAEVRVAAGLMKVEIEGPARARPGEEAGFTLRADPRAAFSVAAVDEAIFMIREDDTPEIYSHFYTPRPAAIAYARFGDFEFDGEPRKADKPPSHPRFGEGCLVSDRLFRGKGIYDVIGVGGGGGGRYGGRYGGRMNLVARGGGGSNTEDAVLASMPFLGRLQKADGSWATSYASEAGAITDTGATGLVLLKYLGAGYSHLSRDTYGGVCLGDVVRKGLQCLIGRQAADGCIGPREGDWILNHALGALALSEAYGLTGSDLFKDPAQRAVDFVGSCQSADGGWNRRDRALKGEILTSAFAVMVLKSAQITGLNPPAASATGASRFFNGAVDDDGLCESPTRATVGGAMVSLIFLGGDKSDPRLVGAAHWLLENKPSWNQQDFLGWHLGSLALFQYDGPSGPRWKAWNGPVKDTLVRNQGRDGSWTVRGETICPTALGGLTLEVYYRYANVFGVAGADKDFPPLAAAPRVRLHFPDTAFWAPELVTDDRGEARFSFRIPDAITTTRLTARGVTKGGALGQAVARVETRQPFFVKVQCPEFAVLGDEIEIRADLYNYTKSALAAVVRLEGSTVEHGVNVPVDRPASVSWRVRADDPRGLRLSAGARAGRYEDAMERVVPVRRPGRERWVAQRGKSETGQSFPFTAPEGVQSLVLKVHPRRGNLSQLLDALRYLNEYPYG